MPSLTPPHPTSFFPSRCTLTRRPISDVHVQLEEALARHMGTDEAIIFSYDMLTVASTLPAFSKRGDLVVVDEGVSFAVQNGVSLSRSEVRWFKHNDVADLQRVLESVRVDYKATRKPLNRRFIVVEGVYSNYGVPPLVLSHLPLHRVSICSQPCLQGLRSDCAKPLLTHLCIPPGPPILQPSCNHPAIIVQSSGDIAPLKEIVALKNKYCYRLVVDESIAFGALPGPNGRGASDFLGVPPSEVDITTASLGTSLGSVGGFCAGEHQVIEHQRINASGYCFSASLPPYLSAAAIASLEIIQSRPALRRARWGRERALLA